MKYHQDTLNCPLQVDLKPFFLFIVDHFSWLEKNMEDKKNPLLNHEILYRIFMVFFSLNDFFFRVVLRHSYLAEKHCTSLKFNTQTLV
jgi:hypothetical protein